jgi:hypothetical protein
MAGERANRSAVLGGWSCGVFGLAALIWGVGYLSASAHAGAGPHTLGTFVLFELMWAYAVPSLLVVGAILALIGLGDDVPSMWSRWGAALNALGLVVALGSYLILS